MIPYVIGPVEVACGPERTLTSAEFCPVCGELVENLPGEVAWYCVNSACPAQLIRNLEHFVFARVDGYCRVGYQDRRATGRGGFGPRCGGSVHLHRDVRLRLEGFADKKVDNLLAAIEASNRQQSPPGSLTALGIRGVGEVVAADLTSPFPDLDSLAAGCE